MQNPPTNGFDFIGEPSQVENVEQVSQNRANMESMIQEQPLQDSRANPHLHSENINQIIENPENVKEPVNPARPSQGFEEQRMVGHVDMNHQSREIPMNRPSQVNFPEHSSGRNVGNNMVPNHQATQQMEMNAMQMGRQNPQYYQPQKYHQVQENAPMGQMRGEVVMPNNYRQPPQGQEMYTQAVGNRQYMQNPAYNPQMMGTYYDNHSAQMQSQVTPETYERIANLERIYYQYLQEPVRISLAHGQLFANYRGTKVPVAKMNEYVNNLQKEIEQREYRQPEYYAQSQPSQPEFHMNQPPGRINPNYKNQQMPVNYAFPNGGHYDHHPYTQSKTWAHNNLRPAIRNGQPGREVQLN